MKNFNALFDLMSERKGDETNLFSVRKIATMSILEVFKDILPEYRIGQIDLKTQQGKSNRLMSLRRIGIDDKFDFSQENDDGASHVRRRLADAL